ncbi:MAG: acetyl-CoA acetyltransferase [Tardiphaga sp.]|jgi:acetyl-CoA C-acetyltransferase|nr:acetyl-CoA acetyltransferase [Tardiphaga sp.]
MTAEAFIFDAVRTPRGKGKKDGALHHLSPLHLMAGLLRALESRNGLDTSQIEDVILGCAEGIHDQGANIARSAVLAAGFSEKVPGTTVARFCGSGLEAVNMAAAKVKAGQSDLVIAGGIEMMSLVPMVGTGGPMASDIFFNDASWLTPQGVSADLIATLHGYARSDVDAFATESHRRAHLASTNGWFDGSIVPVIDQNGEVVLSRDELIRSDTTVERLAQLRPSFAGFGKAGFETTVKHRYTEVDHLDYVHHAGNSSGIADGAAAILIGSAAGGEKLGLKPRARIRAMSQVGVDPCIMLTAPAEATRRCLDRVGLTLADVDLFEVNEAFASVALYFMEATGAAHGKVNPVGGAIAMGHPIGATGAILTGTLTDELHRQDRQFGVATMCTGLGMGVATLIERV